LWKWTKETNQRYDIVAGMTIGFEPVMAAGQAYARRVGAPFVCYPLTHFGAGPTPGADPVSRYYTLRHQTAVVLRSDMVIAQTPTEQNYYEARGLSGENFLVGGPGVNPSEVLGGEGKNFAERFGIENPLILFIGYLSRDKGAFDTLEAGLLLRRQGYDVDLAFIGTISSSFQDRFDRLSDSERNFIRLLGPVDDSIKRDALAAASALSMPSRTDSFGITYLEAWLYGIPVIAARTWGVTDVVDHGTDGLVVPFGDVNALTGALGIILDNPNEAKKMGERGRAKVYQTHLWETKLRAVEDVYQRLISEKAE
jgi:glycosyltransferase involved in cell wall biosynthesis